MMIRLLLLTVMLSVVFAFNFNKGQMKMRAPALKMSTTATERIIMKPLPRIYAYGHCPFCVRVRLAFGLKNIKHEVYFLANDDIDTPTELVGKKIAPIYENKGEDLVMMESLDIIAKVDEDPKYGPVGHFKPMSSRTDIKAWQKSVQTTMRMLTRPRYMMVVMPEFAQKDGKDAFVKNHPIPPYEKPDWKGGNMGLEQQWALYNEAYVVSKTLIPEMNKALEELDSMVYSSDFCTEGGLSYDDIDLFSRLRSLTLVKGIVWPDKLGLYMQNLSDGGDVPLYNCMAV